MVTIKHGPIGPGSRVRLKKGAYIWHPEPYVNATGTVRTGPDDLGDCLVDFDVAVHRFRWVNKKCLKRVG